MSSRALSGVKIVDFSFGLAGPVSMMLLAFMGAEVIKVESARRPDFTRIGIDPHTGKPRGGNQSPTFNASNLNKLGIRLNLAKKEGVEIAKRLVKISNVAVEGFRPGTADRLGIGYPALKRVKPDIIMLSISAMGATGPEAEYIGYAPIFSAAGGIGYLTGYTDGPPTEIRYHMDIVAATSAAAAVLAALNYWQRTGKGQHIDLSCRETVTSVIGNALLDFEMNGRVRSRQGNRDQSMAPHNCYRCRGKDAWLSLAVANDHEWQALCRAMSNPEWANSEKFANGLERWEHQEELDRLIEQWTMRYTPNEAMKVLQEQGVAAVPSFQPEALFNDPHLTDRRSFQVVEHDEVGPQFVLSPPWKLSQTPAEITRPSPLLGQHNEKVFGELLGMSRSEIARLETEQVIY